jgi:hypothetical protein
VTECIGGAGGVTEIPPETDALEIFSKFFITFLDTSRRRY